MFRPALPAAALPAVLLFEPGLEWLEVVADRRGVDLPLTGERFQDVGPWFAPAHLQHAAEFFPSFLVSVDRAAVQRPLPPRLLAKRALELELLATAELLALLDEETLTDVVLDVELAELREEEEETVGRHPTREMASR